MLGHQRIKLSKGPNGKFGFNIEKTSRGIIVWSITSEGAAEDSELLIGDQILAINEQSSQNRDDLLL